MVLQKILIVLLRLAPVFLGVLLVRPGPGSIGAGQYIDRLLTYAPLFLVWHVLLGVVPHVMTGRSGKDRLKLLNPRDLAAVLSFALISAAALFLLQYFREKFEPEYFYLALVAMSLGALQEVCLRRGVPLAGLLAAFLHYAVTGWLSYLVLAHKWFWEPLVFSAGLAFMLVSVHAAEMLGGRVGADGRGALKARKDQIAAPLAVEVKRIIWLYPVLICAAPVCIATLAYLRKLPIDYVFLFVVVLLSSRMIPELRKTDERGFLPPRFVSTGVNLAFLFLVLLILLEIV